MSQRDSAAAAGEALSESEQQFRLLADNAPVLIWRAGPDSRCDYFNAPRLEFTGRTLGQETGDGWLDGVHPEDRERCAATYRAAFEARHDFTTEYRLRRHDGAYRWVLDNGHPYQGLDGRFAGFLGSGVDVTEKREVEERLREAVAQKDYLLHELHHRVKNNMQLILSLLRLQARRAESPLIKEYVEDSTARIHAVALAQSQISQSDAVPAIELAEYLKQLVASLRSAFGRDGVRIHLDVPPIRVIAQRAVPLGLVANELIANALKHAFPEGRDGVVDIIGSNENGVGRVAIADDGIGLAGDVFPGRGGLGFQLVAGLSGQANATVERQPAAAGTRFSIEFPVG